LAYRKGQHALATVAGQSADDERQATAARATSAQTESVGLKRSGASRSTPIESQGRRARITAKR
jgi:uncharacterized membrane protein YccC